MFGGKTLIEWSFLLICCFSVAVVCETQEASLHSYTDTWKNAIETVYTCISVTQTSEMLL